MNYLLWLGDKHFIFLLVNYSKLKNINYSDKIDRNLKFEWNVSRYKSFINTNIGKKNISFKG